MPLAIVGCATVVSGDNDQPVFTGALLTSLPDGLPDAPDLFVHQFNRCSLFGTVTVLVAHGIGKLQIDPGKVRAFCLQISGCLL